MSLPVTTILSGFLAIILIVLSARVIAARQAGSASDDEKSKDLIDRRMRGQANFVEYVPLTLVLFAILELQHFNAMVLSVLALMFAFARAIHGYAFGFSDHWPFGRFYGTLITFTVIGILGLIAVVVGILAALG